MLVVAERWSGPSSRRRPSGTRAMSWEGSRLPSSKPQNKTPLESWRLGQRCPFWIDLICMPLQLAVFLWRLHYLQYLNILHPLPATVTKYCARCDKALEIDLRIRHAVTRHPFVSFAAYFLAFAAQSVDHRHWAHIRVWNSSWTSRRHGTLISQLRRSSRLRLDTQAPSWKERHQRAARAAGLGSGAT